ncbi:MAG: hypothetical protein QOH28_1851, partial [Actinomycetota bacterium]|nr:hypothetical protein [Actinomycetota bacterium]
MPIEVESPEQLGYDTITNNLSESSVTDRRLADLGIELGSHGGVAALDERCRVLEHLEHGLARRGVRR